MPTALYRYTFSDRIPLAEIEGTLLLAVWGSEALHGEAVVRLHPCHRFDPVRRLCEFDTDSGHGRDIQKLFEGYATREYGPSAFHRERVPPRQEAP